MCSTVCPTPARAAQVVLYGCGCIVFATFEGWVVQLHFFSFNKVAAAILSSSISCSSALVIPTHSLPDIAVWKDVGHPAIHKQHSQTFANLCRCSPIFPLILKNQTGMFPCHWPHYLQRHIVPVFIWIWVKDFRIATQKKWAPSTHRLLEQTSEACTLYCMLLVACQSQKIFDTQNSDPNNLLCLTMGSAWTVVSLNLLEQQNTQMSSATHRWGSSQGVRTPFWLFAQRWRAVWTS